MNDSATRPDGIHTLLPRELMAPGARKLRDIYARQPGAPLYHREFGYYCIDEWKKQGLPENANFDELFHYDPPSKHSLGGLGWCEAALVPAFKEEVLEDRGEYEVVRDWAGRHVLCFKGRRNGFMPEYLDHPVKDQATWERDVQWRLAVNAPGRFANFDQDMAAVKAAAAQGMIITQGLVGGYMYLRSLIGPAELLYAFMDQPQLIHACMRTWFTLADAVIARHQQHVTLDEIFFAEDICYNKGALIGPAMMREFLLPYYQQLIANLRRRQIDQNRHLYVQIDTDGNSVPVIPLYQEIGMDAMSPFEVASGCDVVAIGRRYPELVMLGGIDKRVLARTTADIDRMVERILPTMRARGGYTPTCDHGVPAEVPYANYLHYRRRCVELAG
jgi:uroporphyrinogen decarboxylase